MISEVLLSAGAAAVFKSSTNRLREDKESERACDPGAYDAHSNSGLAATACKSFSKSQVSWSTSLSSSHSLVAYPFLLLAFLCELHSV